mgnify:CR=1 FL=1
MKRLSITLFCIFLSTQVYANADIEYTAKKCNLIKTLSIGYAQFKNTNGVYPPDSINYKDPIEEFFFPVLDTISGDTQQPISKDIVAMIAQATLEGESIFIELKKGESTENLKSIDMKIAINELSCFYKHGFTIEQITKFKSKQNRDTP